MKTLFALAACCALTALCCLPVQAASTCYVCLCNTSYNRCQLSCAGYTDAVSLQSCSFSCDKTYSSCMDTAYAAMSAQEQANQASLNTTASSK